MTLVTAIIRDFLTSATVVANVSFVLLVVSFLRKKRARKGLFKYLQTFKQWCYQRKLGLSFLIALVATSGSLFYSEVMGWTPCSLCWYQRIFMYPLVLILGIALLKKDDDVKRYVVPMTVVGALIAVYHYSKQVIAAQLPCPAVGASCATKYTFTYGYITIPFMAFSAFVLIWLLLSLKTRKVKRKR